MIKKRLKWAVIFSIPLFLAILPFSGWINISKYFTSFVLQPKKTGITTFYFHDNSRNRPVITEVWYPIDPETPAQACHGFWMRCDEARDAPLSLKKSKYPLILMSHGLGGDRFTISWLAEILAANGYIVAAMDHYGGTWNNRIPEHFAKPWERPLDISFALDELLGSSRFKDRIDQQRIGFAGYSLGGATGIWIAGAQGKPLDANGVIENCYQDLEGFVSKDVIRKIDFSHVSHCYRDSRVSAMVVMAPALGWLFDEKSLEKIEIPVMIVASEKDDIAPPEKNAAIYAKKITRASFKMLPEANHYVYLNRASIVGKRFLEKRYCEDPASIDRKQVHEDIASGALDFFDRNLQ